MYQSIWNEMFSNKDSDAFEIKVKFYSYTSLKNTIRRRGEVIFIRISDMLSEAPEEVIHALGIILFCKLEQRKPPKKETRIYKDHVNSKEMQKLMLMLRKKRGKKQIVGSKGDFYDLRESYDRVNSNYFYGKMKKPVLTWSRRRTRVRFGHHDTIFNTIVISRTLDDERLPRYLLDYVMFHEMLHMKHGLNYKNGRRIAHSKAFKDDEKRFEMLDPAKALLKKIAGKPPIYD
jgi:hypothetical protein